MQAILPLEQQLDLMKLLRSVHKIVIMGHKNPDGDAMGAALGWADYLTHLGKSVRIVMPNPCPDFYRWLPGAERVIYCDERRKSVAQCLEHADLICCLDFNALNRLGDMGDMVGRAKAPLMVIDHHLDPDLSLTPHLYSFPDLSSTSEVVFRLISLLGGYEELSSDGATALYCGMMTDTGAFTYNSSRPEIYEIISLLLQKGIDKDDIYRKVFHCYSPDRLRLQGYILYEKLKFYVQNKASIFTLTREEMKRFHFIRGDGEGIVNMPLQVKGMRLSVSLREDTERDVVRVSLRSVGDFPCNQMAAEYFNGGGHLNASGGELPFPLEEAVKKVEAAIEAYRPLLEA